MRRMYNVLLLMLIATMNLSYCKLNNKTKPINTSSSANLKTAGEAERVKRSLDDEDEKPFWANRGKKQSEEDDYGPSRSSLPIKSSHIRYPDKMEKDQPFWGNRGRRVSSEEIDDYGFTESKAYSKSKYCPHCKDIQPMRSQNYYETLKERRDEMDPFWGNRGRRGLDEDNLDSSPFWGNRGRRQEDDPFWGTRGRREELPFWGNRGRRENFFLKSLATAWGHRRNEEDERFWGNRGRRDEAEPFWGNRGRREHTNTLMESTNNANEEFENIYKIKSSLWNNFGRESSLKHLFNGASQNNRLGLIKKATDIVKGANTVSDDRIFAEQPHYIVVERSSRSSNEDDPYFISRGKKHYADDLAKAARDRRNAIEDIFKSVKSDPYFIARGKKSDIKINNSSLPYEDMIKAKELVCSTIDFMMEKNKNHYNKRSIDDSDRGRRAVLQKLAAQLQSDPYFVSRGKKYDHNVRKIIEFVSELSEMCF